jgi:hypothetical protein
MPGKIHHADTIDPADTLDPADVPLPRSESPHPLVQEAHAASWDCLSSLQEGPVQSPSPFYLDPLGRDVQVPGSNFGNTTGLATDPLPWDHVPAITNSSSSLDVGQVLLHCHVQLLGRRLEEVQAKYEQSTTKIEEMLLENQQAKAEIVELKEKYHQARADIGKFMDWSTKMENHCQVMNNSLVELFAMIRNHPAQRRTQ